MSSAKYHAHAIAVCAHPMRRHQYTSIKIKGKRAGSKEERKGGKRKERKTTGALVVVMRSLGWFSISNRSEGKCTTIRAEHRI